jgi:NitT/TauT family transport system permease protein
MAKKHKLESWAPWIALVLILLVWELICRGFGISDFIFSTPALSQAMPGRPSG